MKTYEKHTCLISTNRFIWFEFSIAE